MTSRGGWVKKFVFNKHRIVVNNTVRYQKGKNIKPNWQVVVVALPLWLWDLANCISCQWPNQKTRNKWAPTPADHAAKSQRPPSLCRGTLHTEGLWKNSPGSFILLSHLLWPVFEKYYSAFSSHYGLSECFGSLPMFEALKDCWFVVRLSQTFGLLISTLVTQQCRWIPWESLARPFYKSYSLKHFSQCCPVQPNSLAFSVIALLKADTLWNSLPRFTIHDDLVAEAHFVV